MLSLLAASFSIQGFDTVGPICLSGKLPSVTSEGVQAAPGTNIVPKPDGYQPIGQWIWRNDGGEKPLPTRFRKSFDLLTAPKTATLYASAEASYRLWINGRLVSRGPADAGRDYDSGAPGPWFDDVRSVAPFLKAGHNVIAAEVFPEPLVSSEGSTGHPGLKVDLHLKSDDDVATDADWKCKVADDLAHHNGDNGYRVDAELEPVGWQNSDFKDTDWSPAMLCEGERSQNLISELAPPLEAIVPASGATRWTDGVRPFGESGGAVFSKDGGYALRYPRVMSARIAVSVLGHKGARLLIMPNEADAPGYNRRAEILLREGLQVVELPYFDSFSTINFEAKGMQSPITVESVRAIFCSYPVRYIGNFQCDKDDLNRVWKVSRWVTQICMQTHHLDSPHHQEPISDAGDYLIEDLNNYYAFGEGALARQDLRKIARTLEQRKFQSFHTSYSLLWLQNLMQYCDYTGDASLPVELAEPAHKLLDQFETYIGQNGLISNAPNYMFMDWVTIAGFNCHHPPAVIGQGYMTALYYQALGNDKRIAELQGDQARIAHDNNLMAHIKEAFDRELWNSEQSLYRDGKPNQSAIAPNQWMPADQNIETFSTQVNSLAVDCGLTDPERSKAIMRKVLSREDLNCQPYFMHFVFQALTRAGLFEDFAPAQLARWKILPDSQSFYEMWGTGDRSHAWNATPLFQMSGVILGVTPLEPGFKTFAVSPHPCDLQWAKGTIPTPHGQIVLEWHRDRGGLNLKVEVPSGTQAVCGGKHYEAGDYNIQLQDS